MATLSRRSSRSLLLLGSLAALVGCGSGGSGAERGVDPHAPDAHIRALLDGSAAPVLAVQGDTIHLSGTVREFYRQRAFGPAWTGREGLLQSGSALAGALRGAVSEGLDGDRFQVGTIEALLERARTDHEAGFPVGDLLGSLDVLMTESFVRYADQLLHGSLSPDSAGLQWQIEGDARQAQLAAGLLAQPDPVAALLALRPAAPFYEHLRAALPRYRQAAEAGGWPRVDQGEALEEGVQGQRVLQLRNRLRAEGDPAELELLADPAHPERYDAALAEAVRHFQERHGLEADGRVGAHTLAELNVPAEDRLLSILLNLDRWRWLPRELGERYVLVNVAGFEMAVVEAGDPVLRMNVVVGKEGWSTPVFRDTLEYVVVNPYWNVPRSIVERDLVPAVQRDPGYLARNGYEVVTPGGRRVEPSAMNVSSEKLQIRQRPGANNALGEVKFLFPNSMNIYLHDTPARHLFRETRRMFSSGCIRVEKPKELAEYLLRTAASKPEGTYERLRATGREQWVTLDEKLPVYILYFTAWGEPDGSVSFHSDVYRRDDALDPLARAHLAPDGSAPRRDATLAVNQDD